MIKHLIYLLTAIILIPFNDSGTVLNGGVSKSKEVGMVGLTRGLCNKVIKVIRYSPAYLSDVQPGDIIVTVDGKKGKSCRGLPGAYAIVVFKRGDRSLTKSIQRSPESQITNLARKYGYIKL